MEYDSLRLWRVVTRLVEQVAHQFHQRSRTEEEVEVVPQPAEKQSKFDDPTWALLEEMIPDAEAEQNQRELTPNDLQERKSSSTKIWIRVIGQNLKKY